ncbi:MAG: hypothetical protein ACRDTT_21730, partial [Pseudonocardiaceae bacterium]
MGLFFGVDFTGGSGFPIDDGADQLPSLPAEGAGGGLQTAPDPKPSWSASCPPALRALLRAYFDLLPYVRVC